MGYRGYHLEEKSLMVGYQVTITHNDAFVRHSAITRDLHSARSEAQAYVDDLIAQSASSAR